MSSNKLPYSLLIALALAGCVDRQAQSIAKATQRLDASRVPVVQTISASVGTLERLIVGTGIVASDNEVVVSSELAGRILRMRVREGEIVRAGQVIAELDSGALVSQKRQAEAQTSIANAQWVQARRSAELSPARAIAQMRASEAELNVAEAELRRLKAGARPEEIATSASDVSSARANLIQAQKELRRNQKLADVGGIAQSVLDASIAQQAVAQENLRKAEQALKLVNAGPRKEEIEAAGARVRQAQQNLLAARASVRLERTQLDQVSISRAQVRASQAGVATLDDSLARAVVRAPISGQIYGKPLLAGTVINPGEAITRIIGDEGLTLELELPSVQIAAIRVGQPVRVALEAGTSVRGTVSSVSPKAERAGRVYRVRVQLTETAGVRAGDFGRAQILAAVERGVVLPADAVRSEGTGGGVFIVRDGVARLRPVRIRAKVGDRVTITGINPGDRVVVSGQSGLSDGAKVQEQSGAAKVEGDDR